MSFLALAKPQVHGTRAGTGWSFKFMGMVLAQVYRSSQRIFDCKVMKQEGGVTGPTGPMIEATALGLLLKEGEIVIGDHVEIEMADAAGDGNNPNTIVKVLPRKSEIYRFYQRESRRKVTAANCDLIAIINSVSAPSYKRGILDRFVIRSYEWRIPALVIFNKMDEYVSGGEVDLEFEEARMNYLKIPSFELSAIDLEYRPRFLEAGLCELKEMIAGKSVVMLGQSGVGKSRLIEAISGGSVKLKSKEIGKARKGTHTTTWSEIVDVGNFRLIDSPGIRSFSLEDMNEEALISHYPDIDEWATKCQFRNCEHQEDSRGCFFHQQLPQLVTVDDLERRIILSRLESYLQIKADLSAIPSWSKKERY
ncbi:MAG: ribosome small subunit-dependent GTPase A [Oligoflexia bacterium]|nr:ribosome small subunit-dependent GTPase A [Oligoflexia bacterium]